MAFITLTDSQKDQLQGDAGFQSEVKWGILNKATYWMGLDGTSLPGGQNPASLTRWAKSRQYAAVITANPGVAENPTAIKYFLIQAKNIACVDDSVQFSTAQVVAKLLALSSFDSLSDQWFDSQISTAPF